MLEKKNMDLDELVLIFYLVLLACPAPVAVCVKKEWRVGATLCLYENNK